MPTITRLETLIDKLEEKQRKIKNFERSKKFLPDADPTKEKKEQMFDLNVLTKYSCRMSIIDQEKESNLYEMGENQSALNGSDKSPTSIMRQFGEKAMNIKKHLISNLRLMPKPLIKRYSTALSYMTDIPNFEEKTPISKNIKGEVDGIRIPLRSRSNTNVYMKSGSNTSQSMSPLHRRTIPDRKKKNSLDINI